MAIVIGVTANRARRQRLAVARIVKAGGWVEYDYSTDENGKPDTAVPLWIWRRLGVDCFANVTRVELGGQSSNDPDSFGATVSDRDLEPLHQVPQLRTLTICADYISESAIDTLQRHSRLEELALMDARLSNTQLKQLSHLTQLRSLTIFLVGDHDISELQRMGHLRTLWILNGNFTPEAMGRLKASVPQTDVQVAFVCAD